MQFKTKKEEFIKALQAVQSAVPAKSALPILSNLLMETAGSRIRITATDLDMGISCLLPAKSETQGATTVPAKKLLDIVKELPGDGDISISLKKNNAMAVDCGRARFKMLGMPKEEFPQPPKFKDGESVKLPRELLREMILLTGFAASTDETRYTLNGVLLTIKDGGISMVATDGRRLAVKQKKLPEKSALAKTVILPSKTADELSKTLEGEGDVRISFGENQMLFDMGRIKITSMLIDGDFPNYEPIIPKELEDKIKINRADFLSALKRASLFTDQDSLAVKVDVSKNRMMISKSAPTGEVREELKIDYKGKDLSIGFNPAYIIECLKNLDQKDIEFEMDDPEKPGVMRIGKEYVYVVLPMQLT